MAGGGRDGLKADNSERRITQELLSYFAKRLRGAVSLMRTCLQMVVRAEPQSKVLSDRNPWIISDFINFLMPASFIPRLSRDRQRPRSYFGDNDLLEVDSGR